MVLCSIEEAWGSDFKNPPNSTPGYSKTYVKQKQNPSRNRYRYDFSRDSAPLSEHNGSYRTQTTNRVTIPNNNSNEPIYPLIESPPKHPRFSQQNININQQNLIDKYNYQQEQDNYQQEQNNYIPSFRQENMNNNSQEDIYNKTIENNSNNSNNNNQNTFLPNEEEDEYENFQDKNYNDVTDDEYEYSSDNQNNNISKEENEDYETENEDSNNQNVVNVNFSNLLGKVNNLLDYFEQYTKGNGNEMKDIFIFIILGIFFIFILDLIFRIGQKFKN